MIRGILFDLYGTLFVYGDMKKAWADWLNCFHSSMHDCGLKISKDEFSKECDRFFSREEPAFSDTGLSVLEKRIKRLSLDFSLSVSNDDVRSIANLIVGKWQEQISLDADAISTIQHLKKSRIVGLVSNFDHPPHVRKSLSKYDLDSLFDTIVISGEIGVKKPDPRIFEPALAEVGLNATEVAYVGDTREDILAARAANMIPILIKRNGKVTNSTALDYSVEQYKNAWEDEVDLAVSSLSELIMILN